MTYQEAKTEFDAARRIRNQYPCPPDIYATAQARMNEMMAIMKACPEHAASALTPAQLDAKMAQAGFEAAGNAGSLWNKLNPINGNNF